MTNSYLGDDLEPERQKAFLRNFNAVALRKSELKQASDRAEISSIAQSIDAGKGSFTASEEQFKWLARVALLLKGGPDMSKLLDTLVKQGTIIVRNNGLPSGRLLSLVELLDIAENGKLSKGQFDALQKLVQEAASLSGEGG